MTAATHDTAHLGPDHPRAASRPAPIARSRGPLWALLDLFSNVRFGIVLLTLLFFYCSIGSAGVVYPIHPNIFTADSWVHAQLRQWRPFEMTEFEWFHWWPFNLLILLICANLIVTTIRRIRFNVINLGVWTIHTGIVILCIGSVIYFARKVEGDAPIARRQVVATVETPSGPKRVSLTAAPGNRAVLEAGGATWSLEIASIDPSWEIRSGDDAGRDAYSVNVLVNGPGGRFMRQLLAGYPSYTEDVLFTDDAEQPMQRAVKATGKPLVDETLQLALDYEPTRYFYLKSDADKSWALYLRRPGDREWTERPIEGLPLYNDFIASRDDVIQAPGEAPLPIDPIDVVVPPAGPDDPFPDLRFRVTSYLRYATDRSSLDAGPPGAPFNPAIDFTLALRPEPGVAPRPGRDYRMLALDPDASRADEGLLRFKVVRSIAERDALMLPPTLEFEVPAKGIKVAVPVSALSIVDPQLPFTALGESGYSWRVRTVEDDVPLASGSAAVAIVEIRGPKGEFNRWVFDDPRLTRDVSDPKAADAHGPASLIDDGIQVRYLPGAGRAVLTVVAGPGDDEIGAIVARSGQPAQFKPLAVGRPTEISDGLSLLPRFFSPRGVLATKPFVVPREQRMRDAGEFFAKIKVEVEGVRASFPGGMPWLAFHRYPFSDAQHALRRFPYSPDDDHARRRSPDRGHVLASTTRAAGAGGA
jgi:hypothetical protein